MRSGQHDTVRQQISTTGYCKTKNQIKTRTYDKRSGQQDNM